ncbi:hypothetical protein ACJIZ3_021174 [Penstemon smallii]|uniref:Uncharacterized protein n=1 Tax=Penstemon smallii TaxID=265156 RepID=A0ABD3SLC4_9LAMI
MHFCSKVVVSTRASACGFYRIFKNSLYAVRFKGISVGSERLDMSNSSKIHEASIKCCSI